LGYYSGGSRKFGAAGDFVTAPELSPLFGRSLASQLAQWFAQGAPPIVYEFGAGTGALAASILEALAGTPSLNDAEEGGNGGNGGFGGEGGHAANGGESDLGYRIVELSAELRERQRDTIAARVPALLDRVQ